MIDIGHGIALHDDSQMSWILRIRRSSTGLTLYLIGCDQSYQAPLNGTVAHHEACLSCDLRSYRIGQQACLSIFVTFHILRAAAPEADYPMASRSLIDPF